MTTINQFWRELGWAHTAHFASQRWALKLRRLFDASLRRSDIETIEDAPDIVQYQGNKFDIRHPRCTPQIGAAILAGTYEAREIDLMRRYIRPADRVLELGACLGVTSLVLYDLVGPENHLVIEADRQNLAMSKAMFELNEKPVRVEFGLLVSGGHSDEFVEFSVNANPSSSSTLRREGTIRAESVPALSFENVLQKERSTVLVLDIEGGEYDLFIKAQDFGELRTIVMEAHPWVIGADRMNEMLAKLKSSGFSVYRRFHNGRFLVLRRSE